MALHEEFVLLIWRNIQPMAPLEEEGVLLIWRYIKPIAFAEGKCFLLIKVTSIQWPYLKKNVFSWFEGKSNLLHLLGENVFS